MPARATAIFFQTGTRSAAAAGTLRGARTVGTIRAKNETGREAQHGAGAIAGPTISQRRSRRVAQRLGLLVPVLLMACVATNPNYDAQEAESKGSNGVATDAAVQGQGSGSTTESGSGIGASATSGSAADETGSGDSSPANTGATGGGSSTGWAPSESSSSGWADAGGTADATSDSGLPLEPSDLGQACAQNSDCSGFGVGATCCEAVQCLDTCMVACDDEAECPFEGMGCEHGYCLFPCGNELDGDDDGDGDGDNDDGDDDSDCSEWPGFTCQHGMRFCEND